MAKESGLAWTTCSVDDVLGAVKAIVNDVTSLSYSTVRGVQDTTGLDKSAMERLLLLSDFSITLTGVFNDAADKSHDAFKSVPYSAVARTVTLAVSGQTLPNECLFGSYNVNRANDGSLVWTADGQLADGTVPTWA